MQRFMHVVNLNGLEHALTYNSWMEPILHKYYQGQSQATHLDHLLRDTFSRICVVSFSVTQCMGDAEFMHVVNLNGLEHAILANAITYNSWTEPIYYWFSLPGPVSSNSLGPSTERCMFSYIIMCSLIFSYTRTGLCRELPSLASQPTSFRRKWAESMLPLALCREMAAAGMLPLSYLLIVGLLRWVASCS